MSSTVIELRQPQGTQNFSNGDYSVEIPFGVTLDEGDQLIMRNAFIDTEAQNSQQINLVNDLDVTMVVGKYIQFVRVDDLADLETGVAPAAPDGETYVWCELKGNGDPNPDPQANYQLLTEVDVYGDDRSRWDFDGQIKVEYTNGAGVAATTHIPASSQNNPKAVPFSCHIVYDSGAGAVQPLAISFEANPNTPPATITGSKSQPYSGTVNGVLNPILETATIRLPKGKYSPQQLVAELERELQINYPTSANQLLTNEAQAFLSYTGVVADNNYYFARQDGGAVLQVADPANVSLVVGTSQVVPDYIDTTNQFTWNAIHMPFLSPTDDTPSVGFLRLDANNFLEVNKNSGIYFSSLSDEDTVTKQSIGFWDKIMGFNLKTLVANPNNQKTITTSAGIVTTVPEFTDKTASGGLDTTLVDGKNMTGGFIGLGNAVNFTSHTVYYKKPDLSGDSLLSDAGTNTIDILGTQKGVIGAVNKYGYYLVEVIANFMNDFYTNDNNAKFTRGIVSRYYQQDSFTTGTAADSVVYIHKGESQQVRSFRVRILDPDRQVPPNLGEQSTIFLEVIKRQ